MLLGLTGPIGSGKGVVADLLKSKGFQYTSFGDRCREEALNRGLPLTRENLQAIGNELRANGGADILASMTLNKIDLTKNWVIDSIRNPAEVIKLKELKNFKLLLVDASEPTRFQRLKSRNKSFNGMQEVESKTDEEILKTMQIDLGIGQDKAGQQVAKCMEMADFTILNEGSMEELSENLDRLLEKLAIIQRPSWDKYFLKIAHAVRDRSSCVTRQVGAVLVRDKRIIATGYNGTPKGLKHCDEGGCERCALRIQGKVKSGFDLDKCICSHAEENAIVQAALHGISTQNVTLYTTNITCTQCAKMVINAGITRVVAAEHYPDEMGTKLLRDANIELIYLDLKNHG